MSEHVHQVAATKSQFYKISSCAFLGLTRKGEKNGTKQNQPHLRLKKGLIIIYQEVGGGGFGGYHLHHNKFYLIPYEAL